MTRVLIMGGPRTGKSTFATTWESSLGVTARHTDDLIETHEWSAASAEVSTWLSAPGPWVIEGVATVRALRKWLQANPEGTPADTIFWSDAPKVERSSGQETMAKGCTTVWREVLPLLEARGVSIRPF